MPASLSEPVSPVVPRAPAWTAARSLRTRPFPYATIYEHPPLPYSAFGRNGNIRPEVPQEIAPLCKNESNCTVFFDDGTWLTTWGQGSYEHAVDERIVCAESRDMGKTWTAPRVVVHSTPAERIAYGVPFVVPASQRLYLFFHVGGQLAWEDPAYDSGMFHFIFSDDRGRTWSERRAIPLPDRDINLFAGRVHGWINQSPRLMPTGEVVLPFSAWRRDGLQRRAWMLTPSECSLVRLDNVLTESDPEKLRFTLLPEGARGIRVDTFSHLKNPALLRLCETFRGRPEDSAFNLQEMTVVPLDDGRWLGVGRTFLGSPGFSVSADRGATWTAAEPLRYAPGGDPIPHPMTMCPITRLADGRIVLLFTNNDGTARGARHVWEGDGKTRNPQWFAVARQIPGEARNGGLRFGAPRLLAEVDDAGDVNLKTGISMPQFLEQGGRYFIAYNINKEHLLLDEIPMAVLDEMTPA